MGLQIRDERQMKALTGLSQAQFDALLPVFSAIYRATQQHTYEEGVHSGTRKRRPGGGSKGKLPTMMEKLQFVLYYYKTYPTFDRDYHAYMSSKRGGRNSLPRCNRSSRKVHYPAGVLVLARSVSARAHAGVRQPWAVVSASTLTATPAAGPRLSAGGGSARLELAALAADGSGDTQPCLCHRHALGVRQRTRGPGRERSPGAWYTRNAARDVPSPPSWHSDGVVRMPHADADLADMLLVRCLQPDQRRETRRKHGDPGAQRPDSSIGA